MRVRIVSSFRRKLYGMGSEGEEKSRNDRGMDDGHTATHAQCNRRRKNVVAEALPKAALSSDDTKSSPRSSWATTSIAMNVFLLFAVIYHEWMDWSSFCSSGGLTVEGAASFALTEIPNSKLDCSGHGIYESDYETGLGSCRCHPCFLGADCSTMSPTECIIDLYQGDPTMFEKYWFENGDGCTTTILGWQRMSYYANSQDFFFVQTELDQAIRSLHAAVGNAVTDGRHIVIGVGSTQLFQAALYALSSPSSSEPTSVVSLAPYYSSYAMITDYLRSALYKWAGDAAKFQPDADKNAGYIELVTVPNNPTGEMRYPVVNGSGSLVHDLAYYWPHFTPITAPADHDLMLFTVSKSTGHAGTRIGWAIVKDKVIAKKMAKFIELNTIGVSKDAQIRATQILRFVTDVYRGPRNGDERSTNLVGDEREDLESPSLFHFGSSELADRWTRLRSALNHRRRFSLPEYQPAFCTFLDKWSTPTPAFAWLRCNYEANCEEFLREHGILTRSGVHFGADASFVRLSMLDRRSGFDILIDRLEYLDRGELQIS